VGATPVNVRFPPDELADLDKWVKQADSPTTRPVAVRKLVKDGIAKSAPAKHKARMAPLKSESPGMERDSKGNAIPLKQRTRDDKERRRAAQKKR
jgi:hypothetical protein